MPVIRFNSPEVVMVQVPKTGSTSIVHGMLGGRANFRDVSYGHMPEEWMHLYSFAFVRNPFDRLVSCFHMFKIDPVANEAEEKFRAELTLDSVMDVIEDANIPIAKYQEKSYFPRLKLHGIPQTNPFFNLSKLKELYRFENYADSYVKLAEKLGITWSGEVPHKLKAEKRDSYQAYFSPAQRQRAEAIFKDDLREFNYSF